MLFLVYLITTTDPFYFVCILDLCTLSYSVYINTNCTKYLLYMQEEHRVLQVHQVVVLQFRRDHLDHQVNAI